MKTTIYMVRHADSPFVFGQEKERGLSQEGLEDAIRVAEVLGDVHIDYMASSSFARAIQTIQALADRKGLPVVEFEDLQERPIKGLDYKAPWEELLEAIERSFDDHDYALEGGETTREAQARAIPVMEQLLEEYRGKTLVIGTHGNIMTIILNYFDSQYGYEFWNSTSKPDIYKLTFKDNDLAGMERVWEAQGS